MLTDTTNLTRKEIKRIKVGHYAIGVETTLVDKCAFVGCENLDRLRVINMYFE
ncbi:MAG: hypothetical protein GXO75_05160 [Calditrichaeota bacterium]|nr:hypothetical protein [Calditrichota bacterium]